MDTMRAALRTTYRVQFVRFLLMLSIMLGMLQGATAQGVPNATPVVEPSDTSPGSVRLIGWNGMESFSFNVVDTSGVSLDSDVLTSDYHESSLLVSTPGSVWSLSLVGEADDREFSATAAAGKDGALHFEIDVSSSSLGERSSMSEVSLLATNETNFTVTVVGQQNNPLQGHLVSIGDGTTFARTDAAGIASFTLVPGTYNLKVDPYGSYAGTSLAIDVSEQNPSIKVTLTRVAGGTLTVNLSSSRQESALIQVINGDGILIAQGIMPNGSQYRFVGLAHGTNYTIVVAGSELYKPAVHGPFNFVPASSSVVTVQVVQRRFGHAVFIFSAGNGSALPDAVQIELSATDWSASGTATVDGGTGLLAANIRFSSGAFTYVANAPGFETLTGEGFIANTSTTQIRLVLVPVVMPSPTPTVVPSPTATMVPSPTPTVIPSPTPTVVPSPTPTVVPSPTPTVAPSPTPTPTVVPSPTPTVVPSPTPKPLPTAVPLPTPSPVPTAVPTPTPSPVPTAVPTPTPSPVPTAVPSPTPSPVPTAVPTPTPSPVPTAVPTQTPSPSPTAVPTQTPSPVPTAVPTPTPSPVPTAVPSPTPSPVPTAVPSPTPSPVPTAVPTPTPSPVPTAVPSPTPTLSPTIEPSPTPVPTMVPSPTATGVPSPTAEPSPTVVPSPTPTVVLSPTPTLSPSPTQPVIPSPTPTAVLPSSPPLAPTQIPSAVPTLTPQSTEPTTTPLVGDTNFDGVISTTIVIRAPDDVSLEGSPYELYAPVASQATIQPYRNGVVGRGNMIRLDDLPAARYRLVVLPANGGRVDVTIETTLTDSNLVFDYETLTQVSDPGRVIPSIFGDGEAREIVTDGTSGALSLAGLSDESTHITGLPSTGGGNVTAEINVLSLIVSTLLLVVVVCVKCRPRKL